MSTETFRVMYWIDVCAEYAVCRNNNLCWSQKFGFSWVAFSKVAVPFEYRASGLCGHIVYICLGPLCISP